MYSLFVYSECSDASCKIIAKLFLTVSIHVDFVLFFIILFVMGKQKNPIWGEWTLPTNRNGKSYAACKWCGYELQVNACWLKLHTVVHCKSTLLHIKPKYSLAANMSGGKLLSTHDDCTDTRSSHNTVASAMDNVNESESESDAEVCFVDQSDDAVVEPPVKF